LRRIIQEVGEKSTVWMDMEASNYVEATLEIYRRARQENANVGVCLQAYLYRTEKDLASLIPLCGGIWLVKGGYVELPEKAFPQKEDVDKKYF